MLRQIAPAALADTLLAGPESYDDAGAVRMDNGRVALYTVDFFPPVVDDPAAYGAIAAANSLSDIYACGGNASVVLNLAGFPADWEEETLTPVFAAAVDKVREAGALWVGGHSVRSEEPLFGFAVFGEVEEHQLVTNSAAQPGDLLFLTKQLGTGSLTTAGQRGLLPLDELEVAVAGMAFLNLEAVAPLHAAGVRAGTDVTGFGLLGHAANIARASSVCLELRAVGLPLYPGAAEQAAAGVFSGASERGRQNLSEVVDIDAGVPSWLASLAFDAETSGGILACVPADQADTYCDAFEPDRRPALVGEVHAGPAQVRLR